MRGNVANLSPPWNLMSAALNAGTAEEKRHTDVSLRALGKALGVEGY